MIVSKVGLLLFCLIAVACQSDTQSVANGIWMIIPNEAHRVIEADSTLTITCRLAYANDTKDLFYENPIWKWELPDFLTKNSQVIETHFFFFFFTVVL